MKINYNVLVVDDVEKNLQLIGNLLKDKGISITFATNGKQGLMAAKKKKPDLILLDIMMPEMDGYEVCEKLKGNKETKDIPIIFLTAKNEMEDLVKGFALGAVDYITKPFKKEELISRVLTHLELKRSRDIIEDQKQQLELKNISILEHSKKVEYLNHQLKQQNIQLQELINTKDKFFSIISHDLKGPLYNIITFTDLILENYDNFSKEKLLKIVRSLKDSTMSSNKLLENLLEWARSQTGVMKHEPKKIELFYLLEEVLSSKEKIASAKEISIELVDCQEHFVFADESMLNTVLRNLISNAIKFTPKKGLIKIIGKEKKKGNKGFLELEINDSGIGIKEEVIPDLFKIDKKNTSRKGTEGEKGTGLGLILCKEFVKKNKGNIEVNSQLGKGSSFIFTIPLFEEEK